MTEPRKRLNREEYAAGVAARVEGRPRIAPDRARASLEASWLAGYDSVSVKTPEPEVTTRPVAARTRAPDAGEFWPKGTPPPGEYRLRQVLPCAECGRTRMPDGTQAVLTHHVWNNIAYLRSKCCNAHQKLPARP